MSQSSTITLQTCLREARKDAGYQSMGQAGLALHRSQEVIGRHERGDIPIQMQDAIDYAEGYGRPEILMAYCGDCAVRKELFGEEQTMAMDLPLTALRVANRLREAARYADRLAEILDDGMVDSTEISDLHITLDFLKSIETVWRELVMSCMSLGIVGTKKDRPVGTGTVGANLKSAHHSKL